METQAEKIDALNKEIANLGEAFDLIDDHIVITDRDGRILYANYGVQRNTGYSPGEAIGKKPGELWGGNMPASFYENMWSTILDRKRSFVGEVKNKKKDGTEYWQEVRIFPVLDKYSDVKFFIGVEPNISARKTAEGEAKKKFEEMNKLNKFMTERELRMVELKEEIAKLKSQLSNS